MEARGHVDLRGEGCRWFDSRGSKLCSVHQSLELEPHGVHTQQEAPPRLQGAFRFGAKESRRGFESLGPTQSDEPIFSVRLDEFFSLTEDDDDPSNGIPIPIDSDDGPAGQAGSGDVNVSGVPEPVGAQGRKMRAAGQASAKTQSVPTDATQGLWTGKSMDMTQQLPTDYSAPRFNSTNAGDNPAAVRAGQKQGSTTGITPIGKNAPTRQVAVQGAPPPTKSAPSAATAAIHPWGGPMDWDGNLPELPQEGRLGEMFGLTEMPRPKGSLNPAMKAVLDWAQQQTQPFTARQAFRVFRDNGGMPNIPRDKDTAAYMGFQSNLARLAAPEGTRPNEYQPLQVFRQGSRRGDDPKLYRWASKSGHAASTVTRHAKAVAGAPPLHPSKPQSMSPLQRVLQRGPGGGAPPPKAPPGRPSAAPQKAAPPPQAPQDDVGSDWDLDDMGLGPAGASSTPPAVSKPRPAPAPIAVENPPEGEDDEDFGELPDLHQMFPDEPEEGGEGDIDWGAAMEPDEDEPAEEENDSLTPYPDPEGDTAQKAMYDLSLKGLGPDNPLWQEIAQCTSALEARNLIRDKTTPEMSRQKREVARYILRRQGVDVSDLIG